MNFSFIQLRFSKREVALTVASWIPVFLLTVPGCGQSTQINVPILELTLRDDEILFVDGKVVHGPGLGFQCNDVITDEMFPEVAFDYDDVKPANIGEIKLPKSKISESALLWVLSYRELRELVLGDTTFTDRAAASLAHLAHLKQLNINASQIGNAGLAELAKLPNLELLRLGTSNITDDGLAALANCKSLRFLILQNAKIEGPGLAQLHGLAQLESLYLEGNPLSDELALDQLKAALPKLHLHW